MANQMLPKSNPLKRENLVCRYQAHKKICCV